MAIVNRTFASKILGTASPLGRSFQMQVEEHKWVAYEVVGMAEDAVYRDIKEPIPPVAHLPIEQDSDVDRAPTVMIHAGLPIPALKAAVLGAVGGAGPMIGVRFSSLSDYVRDATQRDRLLAGLSAGFGLLALALSAVGIYGVLSYLVTRRRREIGVRLVLGATPGGIVGMVARHSLGWLAAGLAGGSVLAILVATAVRSMLFGLAPTDPIALTAAVLALGATGAVATLVRALRASRLHPTAALRED